MVNKAQKDRILRSNIIRHDRFRDQDHHFVTFLLIKTLLFDNAKTLIEDKQRCVTQAPHL